MLEVFTTIIKKSYPTRHKSPSRSAHGSVAARWHRTESIMDYEFIVLATLWLGGANLIVALSLKRQGLSYKYMLTPIAISKLERRDWGLIALLCFVVFVVEALFTTSPTTHG